MLQETWVQETSNLNLQGFRSFAVPAARRHKWGRCCGGLAVFVSVELDAECQIVTNQSNNNILAVEINLKDNQVLFCINVYVPPVNSAYSAKEVWQFLDTALGDRTTGLENTNIVLGGDFNARMGKSNEELAQHFGLYLENQFSLNRNSRDVKFNKNGLELFLLAYKHFLLIMNGSHLEESSGLYTYHSVRGGSVLDYFIISPGLLPAVKTFIVDIRPESDHHPIKLVIKTDVDQYRVSNNYPLDLVSMGPRRLKWSEPLSNKVIDLLNGPVLETCRDKIVKCTIDPIEGYQQIITTLKPYLIHTEPTKVNKSSKGSWFDAECRSQKKILSLAIRAANKNGTDQFYKSLSEIRSQYKTLLKRKKFEFNRQNWIMLDLAVRQKDEVKFWNMVH
ncbi:uncharacterized protein LOC134296812 [Anolis carolinensis]|uniref:uncharacterized protein LOC134296812 n=1 Tax=Anolis carolinensis TaxID=28377 RepID=UPI002F2B7EE2